LLEHPNLFADKPAIQRQVQILGEDVDRIAGAAAHQELHRVSGLERSTSLALLRRQLRQVYMKPIVGIARAVAPNAPEFAADVRLPSIKATTERLLASADAMAQAVEPKKQLFIDRGLPADFVEQFRAAAAVIRQTIDARGKSRSIRVGATASLQTLIANGIRTLEVLDAILKGELYGTPLALEWKSVTRARQLARPSEVVVPVTAAATEVTAA
jgi:hypothetical protein